MSNYDIKPGSRILELGCGTGDMWKNYLHLIDNESQLILSDFSEGMLKTAKENVGEHSNVTYHVIDIQDIPFDDNSFDIVIANMMLYHVPDLVKGLSEVSRVLKENGTFYCATYGENGIIQYIESLLKEYGVKDTTNKSFTLQNGIEILNGHFRNVQRLNREDGLAIMNLADIMDYIYSCTSMTNVTELDIRGN